MLYATNLLVVASCILFAGILIYFYLLRDPRIWWSLIGVVAVLWMREVSIRASGILISPPPIPGDLVQNLVLVVGLGISTILLAILVTRNMSKRFEHYFNRYKGAEDEKS